MNKKKLEKVTCICEKDCILKNLKTHNIKHRRQPLKYRSAVSKDISSMFGQTLNSSNISCVSKPSTSKTEDIGVNESGSTKDEVIFEPPSKQLNLETHHSSAVQETQTLSEVSKQMKDLASDIKVLRNKMKSFKEDRQSREATSDSIKRSDCSNSDETTLIITHARSLNSILKNLDGWVLSEDGLKCIPCGIVIKYDYLSEGSDFDNNDSLPPSFSIMKQSIVRHLTCDKHIKSYDSFQTAQAKKEELLEVGKQCGINCASAAYTCIYFAESKLSYEYHIAGMYNSGGLVGTKNHSKNFPELFRPHLYDVLRSNVSNYVTSNNLPFGLLADKMTTKHLTRHMVGIRIPIWDVRYPFLSKDIYVQCSCINDVTGKGIAKHMVETLESFGLDTIYQRENLSGCAMDGQYVLLNIHDHLNDIFFKEYHITWDPAHRIELAINDCNKKNQNFIESTCETIQSVMKLLSCGKPYMELLDQKYLSEHFLTPKIFKSMKFVGHCSSVLKCFDSDFKSIVSTLTTMDTEESLGLQEKILSGLMSDNVSFDYLF